MMRIHRDFVGGNIKVIKEENNEIFLENELRDTDNDWFYWAFCVEGAAGMELTFHMQKNRIGYWGPAVSHDCENWKWHGQREGDSFTYKFGQDENKVFFAHHMLYPQKRFYELAEHLGFRVKELCKSLKGRSVPFIEFGEGSRTMILTARHHACESTGSYVLEGVLEEFVKNPLADTRVMCVPFVDMDGVLDGDQGKGRSPHDHNRDYIDEPLYPETAAIMKYANENGANYVFDFHSPWHWGGQNDRIFVVRKSAERADDYDLFGTILGKECGENSMKYSMEFDQHFGVEWNKGGPCFTVEMMKHPRCEMSLTLESTYFGVPDDSVSVEKLINLGRAFSRTAKKYDEEKHKG